MQAYEKTFSDGEQSNFVADEDAAAPAEGNLEEVTGTEEENVDADPSDFGQRSPLHSNTTLIDFDDEVAHILLEAREFHKISTKSTQFLCEKVDNIMHAENIIKTDLLLPMLDGVEQTRKNNILAIVAAKSKAGAAFQKFSTDKSLDRYISRKKHFVAPVEIKLGQDTISKKMETCQYVPVLQTLKILLEHEDVLGQVLETPMNRSGTIKHYRDGSMFKSHPLFSVSPTSLLLNLYDDDFTVSNPLGNKTRNFKVTGVYFTLGNIDSRLNSKLQSIQLAVLCKARYVKKYGFGLVLAQLIDDVKLLEEKGVTVNFELKCFNFLGTIPFVVSDNLGAHSLGGFQESFSKTKRVCRFCNCLREDMNKYYHEKYFTMRTIEGYNRQVENVLLDPDLSKIYGVKQGCCLNKLKYFHVIGGLPSDLAHDFFEGILVNCLEIILASLMTAGYFDLDYFNSRVRYFQYANCDMENKPQEIQFSTKVKIKQTAAEMWNFIRLLPFFIGDKIPTELDMWAVVGKLLNVVELVSAPSLSVGHSHYLDDLVEDLLSSYHLCFPNEIMKPKMHFIVHYGSQIRQSGMPREKMTLRFESKHGHFKEVSNRTKNKRNIVKTMAMRHQCYMYLFYRQKFFFDTEPTTVGSQQFPVQLLSAKVKELVQPMLTEQHLTIIKHVKVNGTLYQVNDIVILGFENDSYVFGLVEQVFFIHGSPLLLCLQLHNLAFDQHYHAYEVEETDIYQLVEVSKLFDFHPLGRYLVSSKFFVPLRYFVDFI